MFKRILVALDKSDDSKQILEEAIDLARKVEAKLLIVHVLSPLEEGYPMPIYPGPDSVYPTMHEEAIRSYVKQWETYEREGLENLRSAAEKAIAAGVIAEFTQNVGDPGRVICDLARTWDSDLILMGRRGRTGLSEILLGSVSNYVLHHATCSVLILQGKGVGELNSASEQQATVS